MSSMLNRIVRSEEIKRALFGMMLLASCKMLLASAIVPTTVAVAKSQGLEHDWVVSFFGGWPTTALVALGFALATTGIVVSVPKLVENRSESSLRATVMLASLIMMFTGIGTFGVINTFGASGWVQYSMVAVVATSTICMVSAALIPNGVTCETDVRQLLRLPH